MAEPVNFDYNPVTNELDMVGGGGPVPISEHQAIITNGVKGVFNDQNRTNTTNAFGQCHTASNNPAKTAVLVSAASVLLTQGLTVRVGFDNANTADNPTLAINGGWGLYIYVNGAQITTGDNKGLLCGVCEFVCDGSKWHLIGSQPDTSGAITQHQNIKNDGITGTRNQSTNTNEINSFGVCSTSANTAAKTVTILTGTISALSQGLRVSVKFDYGNTADNPTLAVNSLAAANIYVNGAQITTGDNKGLLCGVCEFVYDGTNWNLIGSQPDTSGADLMVNVTYAELVALCGNSGLKPGMLYRITDYACTTTQPYTRSAGNAFDIIVRADAANKLNENAFAAHHAGDTYFASCKLGAWRLKYTLDNNTKRFAWADSTNGKGVIYYMCDEWNNECPYDFKNIQFKRWGIESLSDVAADALTLDGVGNAYNYYYGAMGIDDAPVPGNSKFSDDYYGWFYTFALKDLMTEQWYDYTVITNTNPIINDEGNAVCCYDNHIAPATDEYSSGNGEMAKILNNIVFFNCCTDLTAELQDDYSYCNSNHFVENCYNNSVGNGFNNNSVGNSFEGNSVGNYFYNNSVGNDFYNNSVGNDFYNNSVGNYFQYNSVGNGFNNNSVGNSFEGNSVGNGFNNNSVGNYFYNNSVGNYFQHNSVGNYFYNNSVGNYFYNNSVGNYFQYNSVGNYVRQLTVFEGVVYCNITGGASNQSYVQNAQILNGTSGANSNNKLTITFLQDKPVTQMAGLYGVVDSVNRVVKVWFPADLVP